MNNNVELFVSDGAGQGYTPTEGTKGKTYYYKYTGGDDDEGGVVETIGHRRDIVVTLQNKDFSIRCVRFTGDPAGELSSEVDEPSKMKATIFDADTVVETGAYYKVRVMSNDNAEQFDCDPPIVTKPS